MHTIKFTDGGLVDVRRLPKNVKNALKKELLNKVARDPAGCSKQLSGPLADFRSFSWRAYRIVYRVFDEAKTVAVVGVGAREPQSSANIYRRLETLAHSGRLAEKVLETLRGFPESAKARE